MSEFMAPTWGGLENANKTGAKLAVFDLNDTIIVRDTRPYIPDY